MEILLLPYRDCYKSCYVQKATINENIKPHLKKQQSDLYNTNEVLSFSPIVISAQHRQRTQTGRSA